MTRKLSYLFKYRLLQHSYFESILKYEFLFKNYIFLYINQKTSLLIIFANVHIFIFQNKHFFIYIDSNSLNISHMHQ